jgi:hypothetical protein
LYDKMPEYCGVYSENPYHLLGLHDLLEGRGRKPVSQVVAQLKRSAELAGKSQSPEEEHRAKLHSGFARDYPKVAAFEGERTFRTIESTTVPRQRLSRPDFGEHLEAVLHQYFSEQALPFCARRSDKVDGDPILYRVEFEGIWPVAKEGEDWRSLPEDDPHFEARPVVEALEMYPDHPEFFVDYALVLNKDAFQAWSDSFNIKELRPWHRQFLMEAERKL